MIRNLRQTDPLNCSVICFALEYYKEILFFTIEEMLLQPRSLTSSQSLKLLEYNRLFSKEEKVDCCYISLSYSQGNNI